MELGPQTDEPRPSPAQDPTRRANAPEGSAPAVTGRAFDVGDLLARTWSVFKAQWSTCMTVYWGAGAVNLMIVLTLDLLLSGLNEAVRDPTFFEFLRFVHFLAVWVVPAWLWIGQSLALLKLARGEPVTLEDLFRGRTYVLTTILATIVLLFAAGVPFLVVEVLTSLALILFRELQIEPLVIRLRENFLDGAPVFADLVAFGQVWLTWLAIALVGMGLSLVAMFPVLVWLGQYSYAIIDQGFGVFRCHLVSWRMTRGHVGTVVLVYLAYLTINLAGFLAFCGGLFLTLPWTNLLLAVTYHALSEASGAEMALPDGEAVNAG